MSNANGFQGVGIQYYTWFDVETPSQGCEGSGWHVQGLRPFMLPYTPTNAVQSALFSGGKCYSSLDPETAHQHAYKLDELGVDFVILDNAASLVVGRAPEDDPIFRGSQAALEGLARYTARSIRGAYQLTLTINPGDFEHYQGNNPNLLAHIDHIYGQWRSNPSYFYHIDDVMDSGTKKPLLLFYVASGNNVMDDQGQQFFNGWGGCIPTTAQFAHTLPDGMDFRSVFAIRYAINAVNRTDYNRPDRSRGAPVPMDIWPFQCNTFGTQFYECGYASLHFPQPGIASQCDATTGRSLDRFRQMLREAKGKPFLVIRSFNEFSTTDECYTGGNAFTLEANNLLHLYDGSPANAPSQTFYMMDSVAWIMRHPVNSGRASATVIRTMSRAAVVFGVLLLLAALALPRDQSAWVATAGFVVGLVGVFAWAAAYLGDRQGDRATEDDRRHSEPR